jgi:hypothetical protein
VYPTHSYIGVNIISWWHNKYFQTRFLIRCLRCPKTRKRWRFKFRPCRYTIPLRKKWSGWVANFLAQGLERRERGLWIESLRYRARNLPLVQRKVTKQREQGHWLCGCPGVWVPTERFWGMLNTLWTSITFFLIFKPFTPNYYFNHWK